LQVAPNPHTHGTHQTPPGTSAGAAARPCAGCSDCGNSPLQLMLGNPLNTRGRGSCPPCCTHVLSGARVSRTPHACHVMPATQHAPEGQKGQTSQPPVSTYFPDHTQHLAEGVAVSSSGHAGRPLLWTVPCVMHPTHKTHTPNHGWDARDGAVGCLLRRSTHHNAVLRPCCWAACMQVCMYAVRQA
jgi:hypothetical protein